MGQIYDKVEQFVKDSFNKVNDTHGIIKHLLRTAYWVKQLDHEADEALLTAAVSHDIERAFKEPDFTTIKAKGFKDDEDLINHQEKGAKIIGDYLHEIGADNNFIERVKMLISKHEVGGNLEQNIIKDADSISFFENNTDHFLTNKFLETGKDNVKEKFNWMYEKITSPKAKEITRKWYEDSIERLNKI